MKSTWFILLMGIVYQNCDMTYLKGICYTLLYTLYPFSSNAKGEQAHPTCSCMLRIFLQTQQYCDDVMYFLLLWVANNVYLILICTDCDIGSKEKTKIRNADSNSHNPDPESSIPLLQENKCKVKQWEVIALWSVYIFRL